MKKTVLITILCLIVALTAVSLTMVSAQGTQYVELDMADGNILITEYDFSVGTSESIPYTGNYLIKYTGGGDNTLKVQGAKCKIIFDNVNMSVLKQSVTFEKKADVTLILRGNNSVIFSDNTKVGTAIAVGANSKLTIESENGNDTLEVHGGAYGAGIGSTVDSYDVSAQIVINGGIITAQSGNSNASEGAGIGGARQSGAQVTINGGVINATGVRNAPGIGAGRQSPDGSTVTINGGLINAKSNSNGAGIGGGYKSACSTVSINGGVVNAVSGNAKIQGIGIGVDYTETTDIYINGGSVYSVAKDQTTPDALNAKKSAESSAALKVSAVTLESASDYLYVDSEAFLLPGTHAEGSNTYYFWFEEDTSHKLAYGNKEATVQAGSDIASDGWSVAQQPVEKPETDAPETEDITVILPSEITLPPEESSDDTEAPTDSEKQDETAGTDAPAQSETTAKASETSDTSTATTGKKKGCKSMLGIAGVTVFTVLAASGFCITKKKRS
ncbi:MAG: hypothetical protein ACI3XQ_08350 [Eubacteriales bacterium]